MDRQLKTMRKESKILTPNMNIGKNGFTDQVIKNIKEELSRRKLIKLKILQSYLSNKDKNEVFNDVAAKTGAKIVHKIGFTVTLTKR